jgi:two-component system, cell cycle response regulator
MSAALEQQRRFNVLLVEDNPADALFVRDALARGFGPAIELTDAVRLEDALGALERRPFDVVLLDLGLPDSRGLPTFSVLHARFRLVPVVVVSALADETTMIDAVKLGAQDYLVKGRFDAELLVRVIRHAMERHQLVSQLERSLANVRKLLQAIEGPGRRGEGAAHALSMCIACKRLSAEPGRWETIDEYLAPREETPLTQSTCPDCLERMHGENKNGCNKDL